jgi:hypothetical protein
MSAGQDAKLFGLLQKLESTIQAFNNHFNLSVKEGKKVDFL